MMGWTDRHERFFLRLISRRVRLYTEMVTARAILHGNRDRLLRFHPAEHPLALQLGGSEPASLARAARAGARAGYDEINLNVGCPSDRVRSGRFGACLMAEPELVADCVAAMREAVDVPLSVKCRTGIDDQDEEETLETFVSKVQAAGCSTVIVHARKAWLNGLSPKENRRIPPLNYARVHRLKRNWPELRVVLNGGVTTLGEAETHFAGLDGVMIGRAAYHTPYMLAWADSLLFGERTPVPSRREILERFLPYVDAELERGTPLKAMARHILGLFHGLPGAREWRRYLSERAWRPNADATVIRKALDGVECAFKDVA